MAEYPKPKEAVAGEDIEFGDILSTHQDEGEELQAYKYKSNLKMKPEGFAGHSARKGRRVTVYPSLEAYRKEHR